MNWILLYSLVTVRAILSQKVAELHLKKIFSEFIGIYWFSIILKLSVFTYNIGYTLWKMFGFFRKTESFAIQRFQKKYLNKIRLYRIHGGKLWKNTCCKTLLKGKILLRKWYSTLVDIYHCTTNFMQNFLAIFRSLNILVTKNLGHRTFRSQKIMVRVHFGHNFIQLENHPIFNFKTYIKKFFQPFELKVCF